MPFLRSLSQTAPNGDPDLRWPIDGLAYVAAFCVPVCAGPMLGVLARHWLAGAVGLFAGLAITGLNAWLSDRFVDPYIARFQKPLQRGIPRILINIGAFAWAFVLGALSMLAPIAVFGTQIADTIH